jgi:hypothetical protein
MFRGETMKLHILIVRNPFDVGKDREYRQIDIIPNAPIKNYLVTCLIPDDWQIYYCSPTKNIGKVLEINEIDRIIPSDGDSLVTMPDIKGGGSDNKGKNVLTIVAAIAISYFSMGAGTAVKGWALNAGYTAGAAAFWGYAAAIAVQVAGGYLLSRLNKVDKGEGDSSTYSWGDISNAQGEGNAIPITFGTVRTGGQLLSGHITYDGEKQYLNLLYSGGEGPCDYIEDGEDGNCTGIDKILINGNPSANYRDLEINKRAGLNNQSVITNFNDTYADQSVNTELVLNDPWTIITTTSTAQGLEVILECPAGLYRVSDSGRYKTASIQAEIEYKLHTATTWLPYTTFVKINAWAYGESDLTKIKISGDQTNIFAAGKTIIIYASTGNLTATITNSTYYGWNYIYETWITVNTNVPGSLDGISTQYNVITISGNTAKAVRGRYRIDNITEGQYDVRAKCIAKSGTSSSYSTTLYFKTVSAINYEDFSHPNLILLGIKALASDQLSGGMPTVTWEQTRSKGWVYNSNTAAYEEKSLNVPAWAAYDLISRIKKYYNINTDVLDTVVEGIAVSRMDYNAFNEAATYQAITVNGRQRCQCNYILDTIQTLWDGLKEIESVGRFKVIPLGTKYSCTADKPATPVWMANDANYILGSFSESFTSIDKRANSIEIRFRDKNNNYDWNTAIICTDDYDDEGAVPNPIQITLAACTDWDSACVEGAYLLRQNQKVFRTISHSHSVDAIGVQVGDVYLLQSSITNWGIGGRIMAADANSISLDQQVYLAEGNDYQVVIRMPDDTLVTKTVKNTVDVILFGMGARPCSNVWTSRLTLEIPFTTIPQTDDMFSFGETSITAKPFRVISITRDGDLQRKITGLEYVESVYDELTDIPIPDYVTKVKVMSLTVSEHTDNTGTVWLDISWTPPRDVYNGARVEINGKKVADIKSFETSYSWQVDALGSYTIKVVTIDIFGNDAGDVSKTYTVVGETAPGDITNLDMSYKGDQIYLTWDIVLDPRPISYEVRKGADANNASSLGRISGNEYPIMGDGTYWVAAYYRTLYGDWEGVVVENSLENTNIVVQYSEAESGWIGTCTDTIIDELYFDDIENFDSIVSVDNSLKRLELSPTVTLGYYTISAADIVDILHEAKCTIMVNLGTIIPTGTAAIVQINVGDASETYAGWSDFNNSQKYIGRYFNFRIKLTSETVGIVPIVSTFDFVIDMPDIKEYGNNVLIPAAKTTITYTKTYHSIPFFISSALGAVAGDTITVTNKTLTSVDVEITNSGSYVAREIDYLVRGF